MSTMSAASKDVTSSLPCQSLPSSSPRWPISIYLLPHSRRRRSLDHCFQESRVSKPCWRHIGWCRKLHCGSALKMQFRGCRNFCSPSFCQMLVCECARDHLASSDTRCVDCAPRPSPISAPAEMLGCATILLDHFRAVGEYADAPHPLTLLRTRRDRPGGRTAEQRHERAAATHSITSSARRVLTARFQG